jgi:hypothetical protein
MERRVEALDNRFAAPRATVRAIVRAVAAVIGGVTTKRCWRCRALLRKRTIVCTRCGKWQG